MVTEDDIFEAMEEVKEPFITAKLVGERCGVTRQTAQNHLDRLADEGKINKKKIGTDVVWWRQKEC